MYASVFQKDPSLQVLRPELRTYFLPISYRCLLCAPQYVTILTTHVFLAKYADYETPLYTVFWNLLLLSVLGLNIFPSTLFSNIFNILIFSILSFT